MLFPVIVCPPLLLKTILNFSFVSGFVCLFCLFACYSVYFILSLFTHNAVLLFFFRIKPSQTEASLIRVFIAANTYVKACLFTV
jgi:hypothetical protein